MNIKITKRVLLLFGFFLIFGNMLYAQSAKNCDIAIGFDKPVNNEVFDFGDTAKLVLYFYNDGPDTITTDDTVIFNLGGILAALPNQEIAPGDTAKLQVATAYSNDTENDTITVWAKVLNLSAAFTQTNEQNDSTSVTFVMLGSNGEGIDCLKCSIKKLKIYPNPGKDFIVLSGRDGTILKDDFTLRIYNTLGVMVLQTKFKGLEKQKIDIRALAPGSYFMVIANNGFYASQSFIKK